MNRLPLSLPLLALAVGASAQTWDPAADFSLTANQGVNGVWSYRAGANSNALLDRPVPLHDGIGGWSGDQGTFFGYFPYIVKNDSGMDIGDWTGDDLYFHPGPNGAEAVLRFTAPATGAYRLLGSFRRSQNASSDVFISLNGTNVFSGYVNSSDPVPFDLTVNVPQGGYLDFAVGAGGNGYGSDSNLLRMTIQAVPEPASLAALGLGALALLRRRRAA